MRQKLALTRRPCDNIADTLAACAHFAAPAIRSARRQSNRMVCTLQFKLIYQIFFFFLPQTKYGQWKDRKARWHDATRARDTISTNCLRERGLLAATSTF